MGTGGKAGFVATPKRIGPRPTIALGPTFVLLTWTRESAEAASFNVRSLATNRFAVPSYDWPIVTNTVQTSARFPIDRTAACVWFALTAVDTNGIESDFAH